MWSHSPTASRKTSSNRANCRRGGRPRSVGNQPFGLLHNLSLSDRLRRNHRRGASGLIAAIQISVGCGRRSPRISIVTHSHVARATGATCARHSPRSGCARGGRFRWITIEVLRRAWRFIAIGCPESGRQDRRNALGRATAPTFRANRRGRHRRQFAHSRSRCAVGRARRPFCRSSTCHQLHRTFSQPARLVESLDSRSSGVRDRADGLSGTGPSYGQRRSPDWT
jgi:hypothetical protein